MWNHRIWSAGRGDEGWRWVPDRGDRTANHMDHVHVSFSATPGNAVVTRATASQAPAERRTFTGAVRGVHVVRPGDTLSSIARRHRVSGGYAALFRANQTVVHDPHRIYVGQRLRLPR